MVNFVKNLKNRQIILFIVIDILIGAAIIALYYFNFKN